MAANSDQAPVQETDFSGMKIVRVAAVSLLIAITLTLSIFWLGMKAYCPSDSSLPPVQIDGVHFSAVVADGSSSHAASRIVTARPDGVVVLAAAIALNADDFSVLAVNIATETPDIDLSVFWRPATTDTDNLHSVRLGSSNGPLYTAKLAGHEGWTGPLGEIVLVAHGAKPGARLTLDNVTLYPAGALAERAVMRDQWFGFSAFGQSSINQLEWGGNRQILSPTLLTFAAFLLSIPLVLLLLRRRDLQVRALILCLFILWVLLDGVWQSRLVQQLLLTSSQHKETAPNMRAHSALDARLRRAVQSVSSGSSPLAPQEIPAVLWIPDGSINSYLAFRARYHAQPMNARILYSWDRFDFLDQARAGDYILDIDGVSLWIDNTADARLEAWGICVPAQLQSQEDHFRFYRLSARPVVCED